MKIGDGFLLRPVIQAMINPAEIRATDGADRILDPESTRRVGGEKFLQPRSQSLDLFGIQANLRQGKRAPDRKARIVRMLPPVGIVDRNGPVMPPLSGERESKVQACFGVVRAR